MNRSTLIAGILAGAAVVGLGGTAYAVLPRSADPAQASPIIVYTDTPCGDADLAGCFDNVTPDRIYVTPDAKPSTIAHETMHWSLYQDGDSRHGDECYVSDSVYAQGHTDAYRALGYCD